MTQLKGEFLCLSGVVV